MNCWHCKTELVWECDHDIDHESDNYTMMTSLHCPNCGCDVEVWHPKDDEYEKQDWEIEDEH